MFWKLIWAILRDERGEGPIMDSGSGAASAEGGESASPGVGEAEGGEGEAGSAEEAPVTHMFGEFGDAPQNQEEALALAQKLYDNFNKIKPEFETLRGKTAATERNLALTRQALSQAGIRATQQEDGTFRLEVADKPQPEKKIRFTDQHATLFEPRVLEALKLLVSDLQDDYYSTKEKTTKEAQQRSTVFNKMRDQAVGLMFSYFPQLDGKWDDDGNPTNEKFDANFHNKATEIWRTKFPNNPQGELMAALEAAKVLNVPSQAIMRAKKEGAALGKAEKKILGPVGGAAGGKAKSGQLSKEEYFKLSPEDREKFDKQQVGL